MTEKLNEEGSSIRSWASVTQEVFECAKIRVGVGEARTEAREMAQAELGPMATRFLHGDHKESETPQPSATSRSFTLIMGQLESPGLEAGLPYDVPEEIKSIIVGLPKNPLIPQHD